MKTVDKIQEILKSKHITAAVMMRDLGFSSGLFSQWKSGKQKPSLEKLEMVADYLDTTVEYLRRDELKEKAIEKFEVYWEAPERENLKSEARAKIFEGNLTDEQIIKNAIIVFKALFSRSLEASEFSLKHVDFNTYVSMLLNQNSWEKICNDYGDGIYEKLINKYGKSVGISQGSYYNCNKKIQITKSSNRNNIVQSTVTDNDIKFALFNGSDGITDEMYDEVKQFAEMVKLREENKRKNK